MKCRRILFFSAIVVAMFCVLGLFARPYPRDEYAYHEMMEKYGTFQAIGYQYNNLNGRVTNHFLMDICTSFPLEKVQPFMPFITVITYILAAFSLIGTLIPTLKFCEKFSLSSLFCALTLCFTYSLNETFYWMPGMPYFWSTTLIVFALSLALKAFKGSMAAFWGCVIVLFLNGTMLEQPCVYQGIVAFLAMVYFFLRGERKKGLMAGAFWLVSIAAFCILYFAPGTAVRMGMPIPLVRRLLRAFVVACSAGVLNTFQFFAKPLIYSVIFFLPVIASKIPQADEKLSRRLRVWHIVAVMFAISMFMQYMMGVIGGGGGADRVVSLTMWLMGFTWMMLWVSMYRGKIINSEAFRKICAKLRWPVLIISVLVSANFTECVSALRIAPQFAQEWEARIASMLSQRNKGIMNLQVPPLNAKPGLIFVDISPIREWAGRSFAQYYGAENVVLVPNELSANPEDVRKLMSGDLSPYAKLAENGDLDAMWLMWHEENPGKASNSEEALQWYRRGAEAGHPLHMKIMARRLLNKDLFSAVYWQIRAYIKLTRL